MSQELKEDLHQNDQGKPPFAKAYAFGLVTLGSSCSFHWADSWPQFWASTFENWQSEFLQLIWQAAGLALLLFWGSSQSKESDERVEAKLDALLEERGIDHRAINRDVNGRL